MTREEVEKKIADINVKIEEFEKEVFEMHRDNVFTDEEKIRYKQIVIEKDKLYAEAIELGKLL